MTANKAIERIDRLKPNAYGEEDKFSWLSDLEGMIQRTVFQRNEDEIVKMAYPDDMDKELLVPFPYEEIYPMYLAAQIDYENREYANYNNAAMNFNDRFSEYKKLYIMEHMPNSAGGFKL